MGPIPRQALQYRQNYSLSPKFPTLHGMSTGCLLSCSRTTTQQLGSDSQFLHTVFLPAHELPSFPESLTVLCSIVLRSLNPKVTSSLLCAVFAERGVGGGWDGRKLGSALSFESGLSWFKSCFFPMALGDLREATPFQPQSQYANEIL